MIVQIGDTISSEFGTGKIVAITNQWIIYLLDGGECEIAISISDHEFWVPAVPGNNGTMLGSAEV